MIIMTSHTKFPVSSFGHIMCHLRIAVMHLPTKFCANSSIQFGVIDIFRNPRWRPPPSWIFRLCEFGHSGVLIVPYLCSVLKSLQWSTHICFRRSFDDVTRINFRFRLLDMWSSPHGCDASSHIIFARYLYPVQSYWHISKIKDGGRRHLGFLVYVNLAIPACW